MQKWFELISKCKVFLYSSHGDILYQDNIVFHITPYVRSKLTASSTITTEIRARITFCAVLWDGGPSPGCPVPTAAAWRRRVLPKEEPLASDSLPLDKQWRQDQDLKHTHTHNEVYIHCKELSREFSSFKHQIYSLSIGMTLINL